MPKVPTSAEFRSATNLAVAFSQKRSADPLFPRIELLLDQYQSATHSKEEGAGVRVSLLAKLYYALDRWLQMCDRGSQEVNSRRRPGVHSAYAAVVAQLSHEVRVPVNLLPGWLTQTFGRAMSEHGVEVDLTSSAANYIGRDKLIKFRLEFRNGMAFQEDFLHNNSSMIPADSKNIRGARDPIHAGFSGYVCGMNGDFYSSPHMNGANHKENGFFHSSYMGGAEVLCAGEIKLDRGYVKEINNDSGHYKPTVAHVVSAVEMLALNGVNLAELMVGGHGIARGNGNQFLKMYSKLTIPDRAARPGATPLSLYQQKATLNRHEGAKRAALAFALLQRHCKNPGGIHSWAKKDKCKDCKDFSDFWDLFLQAANKQGGINVVKIPVVQDAVFAGV
jgi:hypothetical protein